MKSHWYSSIAENKTVESLYQLLKNTFSIVESINENLVRITVNSENFHEDFICVKLRIYAKFRENKIFVK